MPPPKENNVPGECVGPNLISEMNGTRRGERAAKATASGGAKSGKKQRKMTDLAEEEMPASGVRRWIAEHADPL
jgi:hypothetical protein